jgi:uncharacterized protein YacL
MGVLWGHYLAEEHIFQRMVEEGMNPGPVWPWGVLGGVTGAAVSLLILFSLRYITQDLFERMMPAMILIVFSMVMGYFIARWLMIVFPQEDLTIHVFTTSTLVLLFGYAGISLGLTRASGWETLVSAMKTRQMQFGNPKIVDTSVIIDGRIADICETGFLEGTLIIPRFVLQELQRIADSSDVLRRAKGRRGLDILKVLQQGDGGAKVAIVDDDFPEVVEVDAKLVRLAKQYNAKILTNDFNLNKVAQIESVLVLNINDLANALKPAVLPDEQMEVKIIKEGKEAYQGVGYLDDGTMVVVDGAREHIGRNVSVTVTSVLQTAAGRMIFSKVSQVQS